MRDAGTPGVSPGAPTAWMPPAAALLLTLLLAACQAAVTPSVDLRVPVPPGPVPVAGSLRLVYELHLANLGSRSLRLKKLEVREGGGGRAFLVLGPAELSQRLFRPGALPDKTLFEPGTTGVVYLELTVGRSNLPASIGHRLSFSTHGADGMTTVDAPRVPVRQGAPVVLSPPLRGGPWVAVYDPDWPLGHRRVIYAIDGKARIPGRYAIDWIRIDEEGRFAAGDLDRTASWLGYGAEVLAAADGVVAATRDDLGESDTVSGHPEHSLTDAAGNYVSIDVGNGRFVFYEHLKPGSIRVEAGERVESGQVIAELGFSGQSNAPHLHFHVADANSPLGAEGLPFVFDAFVLLGAYDDLSRVGTERWEPGGAAGDPRRTDERPGPHAAVHFP
jgi:murein DD-endopeptidase